MPPCICLLCRVYQQVQLYGQKLRVVVEAVGVSGAAVGAVVHHDGAALTAVQPAHFALLAAATPLRVHAMASDSVPVKHAQHHQRHQQQRHQAHQDHWPQDLDLFSRVHNWRDGTQYNTSGFI